MTLTIWALIAIVIAVSALLIFMEHEWGFVLGGTTAVILVISYASAGLILRTPLLDVLLPQRAHSTFDAMAIAAGALLVAVLVVIAFLAGRKRDRGQDMSGRP